MGSFHSAPRLVHPARRWPRQSGCDPLIRDTSSGHQHTTAMTWLLPSSSSSSLSSPLLSSLSLSPPNQAATKLARWSARRWQQQILSPHKTVSTRTQHSLSLAVSPASLPRPNFRAKMSPSNSRTYFPDLHLCWRTYNQAWSWFGDTASQVPSATTPRFYSQT